MPSRVGGELPSAKPTPGMWNPRHITVGAAAVTVGVHAAEISPDDHLLATDGAMLP